MGVRHAWEAGEPIFGIGGGTPNGYWLQKYDVNTETGMYSASLRLYPGSGLPAFGTADITT
jgi:hypothetical protein